jgi:hypothetical protein
MNRVFGSRSAAVRNIHSSSEETGCLKNQPLTASSRV